MTEPDPARNGDLIDTDKTGDHLVPVSEGGATNRKNVKAACYGCNQYRLRKQTRERREAKERGDQALR